MHLFVRAENTRGFFFLDALVILFTQEESLNLAGKGKMNFVWRDEL